MGKRTVIQFNKGDVLLGAPLGSAGTSLARALQTVADSSLKVGASQTVKRVTDRTKDGAAAARRAAGTPTIPGRPAKHLTSLEDVAAAAGFTPSQAASLRACPGNIDDRTTRMVARIVGWAEGARKARQAKSKAPAKA